MPRLGRARWSGLPFVVAVLLLLALAALTLEQPAASEDAVPSWRPASAVIHPPPTRRVLLVILDGWRRKVALDDSRMPRMAEVARGGSRGPVWTGTRTLTKACVREMLTGRPSSLRDATRNLMSDRVQEPSLLTRMREANLSFSLVDHIGDLGDLFSAQSPEGSIPRLSADGLAFDPLDPAHDALAETAASAALQDPQRRLVVVHLESLDLSGHIHYPDSAEYDRVLREIDARVGRLSRGLDLTQDTLIVIGDHGTDDHGHHGGPDTSARETAYVAVGAGIRPGSAPLSPADLGDTVATLFGLCPPDGSQGAPEPAILALDPVLLKTHCDRCLASRLSAAGTAPSGEARAYFASTAFTPAVAASYKQLVAPRSARSWPKPALGLALAAVGAGLWLARAGGGPRAWILPASIGVLALLITRDAAAVFGFAGLLLWRSRRESKAWAAAAVALSAALLLGWLTTLPGFHSSAPARAAGTLAVVVAAAFALPGSLRDSPLGRAAWLAWTPLAAALSSELVRTDQIPGRFSPGVALVDYALAGGALFLLFGWLHRDRPVIALATLAFGACFYHGWPLAVVGLLVLLLLLVAGARPAPGSPVDALGPMVGALAMLRAVNGGYGFAKIDLSLAIVGTRWEGEPDYAWGAAVILSSYLLPLMLVALESRPAGSLRGALDAMLAGFLCFAGMDLALLILPHLSPYSPIRLEDALVFDTILGLLIATAACLERALDRWSGARARKAGYGFSGAASVPRSG